MKKILLLLALSMVSFSALAEASLIKLNGITFHCGSGDPEGGTYEDCNPSDETSGSDSDDGDDDKEECSTGEMHGGVCEDDIDY